MCSLTTRHDRSMEMLEKHKKSLVDVTSERDAIKKEHAACYKRQICGVGVEIVQDPDSSVRVSPPTHTHTHTHTHTRVCACMHLNVFILIHTSTSIISLSLSLSLMHARTHARTHARARAHTHTHTHTGLSAHTRRRLLAGGNQIT